MQPLFFICACGGDECPIFPHFYIWVGGIFKVFSVKAINRREVHWHINYYCNYSCSYCFLGEGREDGFKGREDIESVLNGFEKTGLTWLINITGGEPFFSPRFIELCEKLVRRHTITLNTNLSHPDVLRFAERIDPQRVGYIHCGMHIQECEKRGRVKDFVAKYRLLMNAGFYVYASYVMFPSALNRFERDYECFKEEGVILRPKVFRGKEPRRKIVNAWMPERVLRFLWPEYPLGYSRGDRKAILSLMNRSQEDGQFLPLYGEGLQDRGLIDVGLDKHILGGHISFRKKSCETGFLCVRMNPWGGVHRCHGSSLFLGNLFEGPLHLFDHARVCQEKRCLCPYMGLKYAKGERRNQT